MSGTKSRDQIYISYYITVTNKRIKTECIYSKLVNGKQGNKENSIWKGRKEGKKKRGRKKQTAQLKRHVVFFLWFDARALWFK